MNIWAHRGCSQLYPENTMTSFEKAMNIPGLSGIEEKIVKLVGDMGLSDSIVYSSFYPESLVKIHELEPAAKLGALDALLSNCLYKAIGLESLWVDTPKGSIALHPGGAHLDLPVDKLQGRTVRAWFGGHLYPEKPTGGRTSFYKYEAAGVTDMFLNEPERYLLR